MAFSASVNLTMHDMRDFTIRHAGGSKHLRDIFQSSCRYVDVHKALGPGDRDHLDQVLVTLLILGQQDQISAQILLGMILSACMQQ